MTTNSSTQFVIIPTEEFQQLKTDLKILINKMNTPTSSTTNDIDFLTAKQFMEKTHMCRSTFDELRNHNKLKVIKKGRKIFVPNSEVQRYFETR